MSQSDGAHGRAFARLRGTQVYQSCIGYCPGLFGSVGATRAVDPARAENRAENDVQHLALDFAASLLFFSDVAGGRDNTTKIVPFPTMRRV